MSTQAISTTPSSTALQPGNTTLDTDPHQFYRVNDAWRNGLGTNGGATFASLNREIANQINLAMAQLKTELESGFEHMDAGKIATINQLMSTIQNLRDFASRNNRNQGTMMSAN